MARIFWGRSRPPQAIAAGAVGLALAGCGGGGGGVGGQGIGPATRPDPAPLAAPQPAASFETVEFNENYALDMVGAQSAYALGAYGDGVIVAVIDNGIDTSHPDLDANISAASTDVVGAALNDDFQGHGTLVAGVIAAEKNGIGIHGIAFDAEILAIGADSFGGFADSDLAVAVRYATDNLAHVINMSLGGAFPDSPEFRQSQINATQAGVILVSAAGNSSGANPEFPGANAGDPAFNGLALAVGAVDAAGNLAGFSNRCGTSADFCLVAPGVAIESTMPGGGTDVVSGTSFSAPLVSGAAALLIQLFPNLTPQEVVQILLDSADDLGNPAIYGHGLLNVDAAAAPLGTLSVPLATGPGGPMAALGDTRVTLGPAFGDALSGASALRNAVALDDFDRAYPVDLSQAVLTTDRQFGLEDLLAPGNTRSVSVPSPGGTTLRLALTDDPDREAWRQSVGTATEAGTGAASLAGSLSTETAWRLGLGLSAGGQFDAASTALSADALFWGLGELTNPHYGLLGSGDGVRLDQALSDATTVSLGWFESDAVETGDSDLGWGGGSILQASLNQEFADGAGLRLDIARVEESDTFLGSQTDGAFGAGSGATSHFMTVSGGLPLAQGLDLIGSATAATSEVSDAGLLSDWGSVRSTAFGVGVVASEAFEAGDRLGILFGQPLRVSGAKATLTVPVALTAEEAVINDSQRVDLSPSGRELNLQVAYDRALWEGAGLTSWLLLRTEPGHDRSASDDYGFGLSFRMAF